MADTKFKKYFSKNAEKSDKKEKDDEEYLKRGRDKKKPLSPEDSYEYLRKCLKANCCNCCYSLLSFFKELFKAVGGDQNNKLCDVLGDMSDLFLAIVSDCFFLLKRCCFCVIESVVPTNKKET
ncbi:unnamed protein product [Danaus chrysippus]|uniref:(African queen) hypothetical protein n=1 Tax=Danaus chrysippus TaxID=151541 RepID=A0A8J2W6D1_9NEOP|nr:unnamed protein product [Danaus chrysippus]